MATSNSNMGNHSENIKVTAIKEQAEICLNFLDKAIFDLQEKRRLNFKIEQIDDAIEKITLLRNKFSGIFVGTPTKPAILSGNENQFIQSFERMLSEVDNLINTVITPLTQALSEQSKALAIDSHPPTSSSSDNIISSPSLKSSKTPEWATDSVVQKVRERLIKINNTDALKELNEAYEQYQGAQPGSSERLKCETILQNIINMPGWGHKELHTRDQLVYITQAECDQRKKEALYRLSSQNLAGIDTIAMGVLNAYFEIWDKMVAPTPDQVGKPLQIDRASLIPPPFVIDGPPGVGKTTIVNAIAYALDMPTHILPMQGTDPGNIVGYTRQYGTPKPSLITIARTKETGLQNGRTSSVILLDELDKGTRTVMDAVGGITEGSEWDVRDEFLQARVPKGFNLIIATTNNFNLLPSHVQSRFGGRKRMLYFAGYSEDEKEKILKNMAIKEIGNRTNKIQFLSKNIATDPKQYIITTENGHRIPMNSPDCFIQDKKNPPFDAIRFIVENYITEAGVREARDLLKQVISKASIEHDEIRFKNQSLNPNSPIQPIVIDEAFIIRALGTPDPSIKKLKDLSVRLEKERSALVKQSDEINKIIESLSTPKDKESNEVHRLGLLLDDLQKHKNNFIHTENLFIRELKHRQSRLEDTDSRSTIDTQIKEHESSIRTTENNINQLLSELHPYIGHFPLPLQLKIKIERLLSKKPDSFKQEDVTTALQLLSELSDTEVKRSDLPENDLSDFKSHFKNILDHLRALPKNVRPDNKTLHALQRRFDTLVQTQGIRIENSSNFQPLNPQISNTQNTQSSSNQSPNTTMQFTTRTTSNHPHPLPPAPPKAHAQGNLQTSPPHQNFPGTAGPKITTHTNSFSFFKPKVAEQIEKAIMLSVQSDRVVTPKLFENMRNQFETEIIKIQNNLQTQTHHSEDQESFRDLTISEIQNNQCTVHRGNEAVMTLHHQGKYIDIVSSINSPPDDALYSMVLAAKISASQVGKRRFLIENCEDKPLVAFKLYLIGKSLGLEPAFKDAPHHNGETLKGILEGEFANTTLYTDQGNKTIKEIYSSVRNGEMNPQALKTFIAQLEHVDQDKSKFRNN